MLPTTAWADWDDRPGADWHPDSTPEHPCGGGAPPRGHFAREVAPASRARGLTLVVRQDGNRLCYVADEIAEAPVIRTRPGDQLVLTLRNEITDPAGIAAFVAVGQLDQPNPAVPERAGFTPVVPGARHTASGATNLHVHGFAVPPIVPQDEVMMTCADPASGPATCGRREVTYRYDIPANMPPGLYWYHPHVHGEAQAQMLMGLSGAIVVEGPDDAARRAAGIQDRIFVVRQSQDNDAASVQPAAAVPAAVPTSHKPHRPPYRPPTELAAKLGGRVDTQDELACGTGPIDEITLNGAPVLEGIPSDADLATVPMASGSRQLWRFVNAATDAFLNLALVDANGRALPIEVVARDGAPIADDAGQRRPLTTTEPQLVPPAGRIEFLVPAPVNGKAYLLSRAVDTGCSGDRVPERRLALVKTVPTAAPAASGAHPSVAEHGPAAAPDLFTGLLARPTDRVRVIAMAEYPRPGSDDQTDFYIAERRPGTSFRPFSMSAPPAIEVHANATEEWELENWTNELHAFHIHQLHFRVIEIDGKRVAEPQLLDVITVPAATIAGTGSAGTSHTGGVADVTKADPGRVVPGRVRIKLAFPASLAGDILFHCHLVDHEDNGMMGIVRVLPATATERPMRKAEASPGPFDGAPICRAQTP
ncbi:hypothetical protein GCM10011611_29080 [Aliidongia dinghuensis]|uniref:Copper oxidase n=1 Tax=Aliidongia dinghuensis TaxID=1867774 RepID=A0A8J2YTY6_9PROT|nr:hypothetical protein GCM10011611_29080 [Aliidongia dinghuensis]